MITVMFVLGGLMLALAYRFYGRRLARDLRVDDTQPTPAHTLKDGVDYVPTSPLVLFGHHFSSIAGAGPILGPIVAGLAFGWLPALAWILIGGIFVGGVHDFATMVASIRHEGRSIGEVGKKVIGPHAYYPLLIFILLTLIYVIIVFLDLTASSFAPALSGAGEAQAVALHQGGVVATASTTYLVVAILFGLAVYRFGMRIGTATWIFVPLAFAGLGLGHYLPLTAELMPVWFGSAKNTWLVLLMAYCFFASILPVWILLQPRDYLSAFLLFACLAGGSLGVLAAGSGTGGQAAYPAFLGFSDPKLGFIFPWLFVTIACGAVSGFHSIVASGTTAKQLNRERDAVRVGYGAMLVESLLALLALATVMRLAPDGVPAGTTPVQLFATGLGRFMARFGLPEAAGTTFALLAVSTFLLTTLDTCTRLARFIVHELFSLDNRLAFRLFSTVAVLALPIAIVFRQMPDASGKLVPVWSAIWPAFGASNQLLAALALVVVFVWMRARGQRAWAVGLPALFMLAATGTSLLLLFLKYLKGAGSFFVGAVSLVLFILAVAICAFALAALRRAPAPRGHGPHSALADDPANVAK